MPGRQDARFVAARDEHQRAVDRHDLVEEHRDVHRPRLRHAVVARPGAVILVPLPDIAVEGRLGVDLVLVHVELFAEQLLDRLDQPRMRRPAAESPRCRYARRRRCAALPISPSTPRAGRSGRSLRPRAAAPRPPRPKSNRAETDSPRSSKSLSCSGLSRIAILPWDCPIIAQRAMWFQQRGGLRAMLPQPPPQP